MLIFAVFPMPAALDWLTQTLGRRESTNGLRLASGFLLGIAVTDLAVLLVFEKWLQFLVGAVVFVLYVGVVALVLKVTGGWRQVVAEHFPGVETSIDQVRF
jgi:predicted membrane protein DUF2085